MSYKVAVFQFEIRFQHILNFSQVGRRILSPYVRLAQSINIDNQNTVNERIILNFEDEDFTIIASWDRLLIKGQGDLNKFTANNSPIETPFFSILENIMKLEEFGSITNVLLAINAINKIDIGSASLIDFFLNKTVTQDVSKLLSKTSDMAVQLVNKDSDYEMSLSFGPYFGKKELNKRTIVPVNVDKLENIDFKGGMIEYKYFKAQKSVTFEDFKQIINEANNSIKKVWTVL